MPPEGGKVFKPATLSTGNMVEGQDYEYADGTYLDELKDILAMMLRQRELREEYDAENGPLGSRNMAILSGMMTGRELLQSYRDRFVKEQVKGLGGLGSVGVRFDPERNIWVDAKGMEASFLMADHFTQENFWDKMKEDLLGWNQGVIELSQGTIPPDTKDLLEQQELMNLKTKKMALDSEFNYYLDEQPPPADPNTVSYKMFNEDEHGAKGDRFAKWDPKSKKWEKVLPEEFDMHKNTVWDDVNGIQKHPLDDKEEVDNNVVIKEPSVDNYEDLENAIISDDELSIDNANAGSVASNSYDIIKKFLEQNSQYISDLGEIDASAPGWSEMIPRLQEALGLEVTGKWDSKTEEYFNTVVNTLMDDTYDPDTDPDLPADSFVERIGELKGLAGELDKSVEDGLDITDLVKTLAIDKEDYELNERLDRYKQKVGEMGSPERDQYMIESGLFTQSEMMAMAGAQADINPSDVVNAKLKFENGEMSEEAYNEIATKFVNEVRNHMSKVYTVNGEFDRDGWNERGMNDLLADQNTILDAYFGHINENSKIDNDILPYVDYSEPIGNISASDVISEISGENVDYYWGFDQDKGFEYGEAMGFMNEGDYLAYQENIMMNIENEGIDKYKSQAESLVGRELNEDELGRLKTYYTEGLNMDNAHKTDMHDNRMNFFFEDAGFKDSNYIDFDTLTQIGSNFDENQDGIPDYIDSDRPLSDIEFNHYQDYERRREIYNFRAIKQHYLDSGMSIEDTIEQINKDYKDSGYSDEQVEWMHYNKYYHGHEIDELKSEGTFKMPEVDEDYYEGDDGGMMYDSNLNYNYDKISSLSTTPEPDTDVINKGGSSGPSDLQPEILPGPTGPMPNPLYSGPAMASVTEQSNGFKNQIDNMAVDFDEEENLLGGLV